MVFRTAVAEVIKNRVPHDQIAGHRGPHFNADPVARARSPVQTNEGLREAHIAIHAVEQHAVDIVPEVAGTVELQAFQNEIADARGHTGAG